MRRSDGLGLLLFFCCMVSAWAQVQDLGVYGQVFSIAEESMKTRIKHDMQQVDWHALHRRLANQASHWAANLPHVDLPTAQHIKTTYFSPATTLTRDIDLKGKPLYHHGTPINPLRFIQPKTALFFFDGRIKAQVALAKQVKQQHPLGVKLVLTAGNPLVLTAALKTPVFYALPVMVHRFHVRELPAMLSVGQGVHHLALALKVGGGF